jgi:hypothetical protein
MTAFIHPIKILRSKDIDNTNILPQHIDIFNKFLDDHRQPPIYYYNINSIVIDRDTEIMGCIELMGSCEYQIKTDYLERPHYYTIYVIHTEDMFDIMKHTIMEDLKPYLDIDRQNNKKLYAYYTPYVEDFIYTDTSNLDADECPICYLINEEHITFECYHSVCMECKDGMLKSKKYLCPICRANILPNPITEEEFYTNPDYDDILENVDFNKYVSYLIDDGLDIYKCCDLDYTGIENSTYEVLIVEEEYKLYNETYLNRTIRTI